MSPEQIEQAKAWTRLRGWRWMPGMRAVIPGCTGAGRIVAAGRQVIEPDEEFYTELSCVDIQPRDVPDITDPATLGCLVQLVRELSGCRLTIADTDRRVYHNASVVCDEENGSEHYFHGETVTEALLAAAQAWEADHE